jgi:hypothetical protein
MTMGLFRRLFGQKQRPAKPAEYLIRRTDGKWFDLGPKNFESTLVPAKLPWRKVAGWGHFRIEVEGCEISFSVEDPGIQVVFEHDVFTAEQELQLLNEMLSNITRHIGQKGVVVPL